MEEICRHREQLLAVSVFDGHELAHTRTELCCAEPSPAEQNGRSSSCNETNAARIFHQSGRQHQSETGRFRRATLPAVIKVAESRRIQSRSIAGPCESGTTKSGDNSRLRGSDIGVRVSNLSPYAAELGKHVATCLHSKEDQTRHEAVRAAHSLARQCSDPSAIRNLLVVFFGVFQGSEGKLTVTSHKISVLEGIGKLSQHCVTGPPAVHQLTTEAADHFIKVLESEVHEGTLLAALDVLSVWTSRFNGPISKSLMDLFKKSLTLKTSTAAIRTSYIKCMSCALHGESLAQGVELISVLLKSLERTVAQPTQAAVVAEGLAAATLLLRLTAADVQVNHFKNYFEYFTLGGGRILPTTAFLFF